MKKRITSSIHGRRTLLLVAMCVSVGVGAFAVQALGSFGKARFFAADANPISVAVGDFNGDSRRDLVVVNVSSWNVSLLLGNGAGSFGKPRNFEVGIFPTSVAVGRLNGDANPDLAIGSDAGASVLLGNGAGGFGNWMSFGRRRPGRSR